MARTKQIGRKMTTKELKAMKGEKAKKAKDEHDAIVAKGKVTLEGLTESGVSLGEMKSAFKERFEKTLNMDLPECDREAPCYADSSEYTVSIVRGAIDGPRRGPLSIDPDRCYDDQLEFYRATTDLDGFRTSILGALELNDEEKEDVDDLFDDVDEMMDGLRESKWRLAERVGELINKNFAAWKAAGLGNCLLYTSPSPRDS